MNDPYLLIADDNANDIELLGEALRSIGNESLQVIGVSDGLKAWNHLTTIPPQGPLPRLIILDLNLPDINGLEFASRLRHERALRKIPVIVVSSSSMTAYEGAHGIDACFEKPGEWADYLTFARFLTQAYFPSETKAPLALPT
jgi:CheY-like chemotaxis protein